MYEYLEPKQHLLFSEKIDPIPLVNDRCEVIDAQPDNGSFARDEKSIVQCAVKCKGQ
jgi:hypothetical protein